MSGVGDIRDIKSFFALYAWYRPLFWSLVGAGALALLFYCWRRFRGIKKTEVAVAARPSASDVVALERLERIRALAEAANPKPFHFELSEVLRWYLEARFGFPATDRTSEEIARLLPDCREIDGSVRETIVGVLKHTDRVKFTDYRPDPVEAIGELERTRQLVLSTARPRAPEGSAPP